MAFITLLLGITTHDGGATTFFLTEANQPFVGGPPYAWVDVTKNANTIQFIVTASGSNDLVGAFGFNTDLELSPSNFTILPPHWNLRSDKTMGDFGEFDWSLGNSAEGYRVHTAEIVISLNPAQADITHFNVYNEEGYNFAAHLFQTGLTGFIADPLPVPTPEASPILLLCSGLIAFAGYGRKKLHKGQQNRGTPDY